MPDPCAYDSESEFHSDCMAERREEHPDESMDQSNAVCFSMWRERDCDKAATLRRKASQAQYKAGPDRIVSVDDREAIFVASTETPDRDGDIVRQNWVTRAFMRNPVFQLSHPSHVTDFQFPIGRVKRWWTEGTKSYAHVEALPEGMDETADKAWRFIREKFLNAVSIGFLPLEEPIPRYGGNHFITGFEFPKSELLELSLVAVPANGEALALAKSLKFTDQDVERIFVKPKGVSAGVERAKRLVFIERSRAGT